MTSLTKQTVKKEFSIFFLHQASKRALKSHVLIKMEGIGKESIMLSMELAKTQCSKFEWFKDNYSLTIGTQGCQTNTRKFNTKRT